MRSVVNQNSPDFSSLRTESTTFFDPRGNIYKNLRIINWIQVLCSATEPIFEVYEVSPEVRFRLFWVRYRGIMKILLAILVSILSCMTCYCSFKIYRVLKVPLKAQTREKNLPSEPFEEGRDKPSGETSCTNGQTTKKPMRKVRRFSSKLAGFIPIKRRPTMLSLDRFRYVK